MAWPVEPGLGVSAALDAEELERCVLCHGVDVVADDKGAGNLVADLDAQACFGGYGLGDVADENFSRGTREINFVAQGGPCSEV